MIQTINNTRNDKFSQILRDNRYVCSIWLPSFIRVRLTNKIIKQLSKLISGEDDEEKKLIDDYYNQSLDVRLNILQIVYVCLIYKEFDDAKVLFKKYMHTEYSKAKLPLLKQRIDKMVSQYHAMNDKPKNDPKEFNFDEFLLKLESILNKDLSNRFVYQIPQLQEEAVRIINENKAKQHGTGSTV